MRHQDDTRAVQFETADPLKFQQRLTGVPGVRMLTPLIGQD
jgi:hypothetical protein